VEKEIILTRGWMRWITLHGAKTYRSLREFYTDSLSTLDRGDMLFLGKVKQGRDTSMVYWLEVIRQADLSEPREKIFAILGIMDYLNKRFKHLAYNAETLIIDYTSTVEDIYSSVVKAVVEGTSQLDILCSCSLSSSHVKRTWTPDWTAEKQKSFLNHQSGGQRAPIIFCASGEKDCIATFSHDLCTMTVKGVSWDVIDTVEEIYPPGAESEEEEEEEELDPGPNAMTWKNRYLALWHSLRQGEVYGSENNTKIAFWRTLVATPKKSKVYLYDTSEDLLVSRNVDLMCRSEQMSIPNGFVNWPDDVSSSCWSEPDFLRSFHDIVLTRRRYVGQAAYRGRVKAGDVVCVLLGCTVPMVLRPVELGRYELIGDVYLDGIMFGEAIKALGNGEVQLQDFELI